MPHAFAAAADATGPPDAGQPARSSPRAVRQRLDGDVPAGPPPAPGDSTGAGSVDRLLSEVLRKFAHIMGTDFPIQSMLDLLVRETVAILPITAAGVTIISANSTPRQVAASDDAALRYEQLQTDCDEGPCLLAYNSGQPVTIADLATDVTFPLFNPQALTAGLRAVFTFPLWHGDKPLGALDLYRDAPGPLPAESVAAAQTLADVAAAYLLNAQMRLDMQRAADTSKEQALHDALTGLPNRTLIMDRLQHALHRSRRHGAPCAVLFIDLDRLKVVNDTYGHAVGDELLIATARRLNTLIRPSDTLGRLSGDEFVVLCEDLDDPEQATAIAGRLRTALTRPFVLSMMDLDVTASIGIALAGGDGSKSPEQLLDDADSAMYQAKRRGGNCHQVFDAQLKTITDHHTALERDLRRAAGRNQLQTAYQPIVHTADGRITGFEALVRWNHPTHGSIPAETLIALAEQSGLMDSIGSWVLHRACADLHRWRGSHHGRALTVAVNVSAQQLVSDGFLDTVSNAIDSTLVDPRGLTLEVTESIFLASGQQVLTVLNDLRDLGVTLALDDFGTGYAALSYLQHFPLHILKIDRSFVTDLGLKPAPGVIIAAILQLAGGLGMSVIAEGVETAAQQQALAELGCPSSQGFYFAEPMPAHAVADLIDRGATFLPPSAASSRPPAQRVRDAW